MDRLLWICLAGALGSGSRYLISLWAAARFGTAFPFGTLIVNLAGCFAIAALMQAGMALAWPPTVRAAATVGFIGGLTTYSSFNDETARLLDDGAAGAAGLNVALTLVGGLAAGWLGLQFARLLLGAFGR
jgi:CrcB protein